VVLDRRGGRWSVALALSYLRRAAEQSGDLLLCVAEVFLWLDDVLRDVARARWVGIACHLDPYRRLHIPSPVRSGYYWPPAAFTAASTPLFMIVAIIEANCMVWLAFCAAWVSAAFWSAAVPIALDMELVLIFCCSA
jgi:hypothetical protein